MCLMSKNQRALLGGPKYVLNEQESKSIVRRSKMCAFGNPSKWGIESTT